PGQWTLVSRRVSSAASPDDRRCYRRAACAALGRQRGDAAQATGQLSSTDQATSFVLCTAWSSHLCRRFEACASRLGSHPCCLWRLIAVHERAAGCATFGAPGGRGALSSLSIVVDKLLHLIYVVFIAFDRPSSPRNCPAVAQCAA